MYFKIKLRIQILRLRNYNLKFNKFKAIDSSHCLTFFFPILDIQLIPVIQHPGTRPLCQAEDV
jgi:hypothetical protein